ncbi:LysR family transcriptional regulator [Streptomyces sp. NPDC004610]|uniref:LysR family transcriptional regulator n=1 Tax=unclassified Streptomyces TaxID=2593676 RepID=UPI0033A7FCBF
MELRSLNLNLLIHLDALLSHRSVSGAAGELAVSQPSMSAALARLRRHFGDELLSRRGSRYELTALAEDLRPAVAAAIAGLEGVFVPRRGFAPGASRREFRLLASDFWLEVMGPALSRLVSEAAPLASVRFELPRRWEPDDPLECLRNVDGMLAPHGVLDGPPHLDLLRTEWRCIADRDNPVIGDDPDPGVLAALPWVVYADRSCAAADLGMSIVMRQLRFAGITPRVAATVATFSAVPAFVAGTDRVALVHRSLAEHARRRHGLRVFAPPFPVGEVVQAFWWHPHLAHDRAHRWLRDLLRRAAAQVAAEVPGFDVAEPGRADGSAGRTPGPAEPTGRRVGGSAAPLSGRRPSGHHGGGSRAGTPTAGAPGADAGRPGSASALCPWPWHRGATDEPGRHRPRAARTGHRSCRGLRPRCPHPRHTGALAPGTGCDGASALHLRPVSEAYVSVPGPQPLISAPASETNASVPGP